MGLADELKIPAHLVYNIGGREALSIDAMRTIAQSSGHYGGQSPVEWTADGREWVEVWLDQKPPAACRLSIYRTDWNQPLTTVLTYREYTQGRPQKGVAATMPAHMLAKSTEAIALRKAFPQQLGGAYSVDEIDQAEPVAAPAPAPTPVAEPAPAPAEPAKPSVYDNRREEVIARGKAIREAYGDTAADELLAVIKSHGIDINKIKPAEAEALAAEAEAIIAAYSNQNSEAASDEEISF